MKRQTGAEAEAGSGREIIVSFQKNLRSFWKESVEKEKGMAQGQLGCSAPVSLKLFCSVSCCFVLTYSLLYGQLNAWVLLLPVRKSWVLD